MKAQKKPEQTPEEIAKEVTRIIMMRTFGWPDGQTVFGMPTERMFNAIVWIREQLWPEEKNLK